MIPGFINIPFQGTLFELSGNEMTLLRNETHIEKLVLQIGCTLNDDRDAMPSAAGTDGSDGGEADVERLSAGATVREAERDPPPEPFSIDTTLIFDQPEIGAVGDLDLRYLRMMIIGDDARVLRLPRHAPCRIAFVRRRPVIEADREWRIPEKTVRRPIPRRFRAQEMDVPGARFAAQAFSVSGGRSITIHRLPTDCVLTLAGQKYLFAGTVFDSIHLVVTRRESSRVAGPRNLVLMGRLAGS